MFDVDIIYLCYVKVSALYRDASIGNAINIVMVRLMLLDDESVEVHLHYHVLIFIYSPLIYNWSVWNRNWSVIVNQVIPIR